MDAREGFNSCVLVVLDPFPLSEAKLDPLLLQAGMRAVNPPDTGGRGRRGAWRGRKRFRTEASGIRVIGGGSKPH